MQVVALAAAVEVLAGVRSPIVQSTTLSGSFTSSAWACLVVVLGRADLVLGLAGRRHLVVEPAELQLLLGAHVVGAEPRS